MQGKQWDISPSSRTAEERAERHGWLAKVEVWDMQAMECRIVPIITEYDPCQAAYLDSPPHLCLG